MTTTLLQYTVQMQRTTPKMTQSAATPSSNPLPHAGMYHRTKVPGFSRQTHRHGLCAKRTRRMAISMSVLVVCLVCVQICPVNAFASNLITTSMGCITDLSTDEVIMNNEVKAAADSDFPRMHLVVLDSNDSNNRMESPFRYNSQ